MSQAKTATPTQPTTEERLEAMETLLQQMVLVLECEPRFTADALARWMGIARQHMRLHNSATPEQLAALESLQRKVLT